MRWIENDVLREGRAKDGVVKAPMTSDIEGLGKNARVERLGLELFRIAQVGCERRYFGR